jgi:signal transduction histidine kinase
MEMRDAWTRWDPIWNALFHMSLAVPTVVAIAGGATPAVAAPAAALAVLHWRVVQRHPERWRTLAPMTVAYTLVTTAAFALLVALDEAYVLALWGLYPTAFGVLGPWGAVAVAGYAAIAALLAPDALDPVSAAVTAALAVLIGLFVESVQRQSEQRREALEQLRAARAELDAAARETGALEERARLAREIHDTVAQGLISVITQLEGARDGGDPRRIDRALEGARDTLREARRAVQALRPVELDDAQLPDALAQVASRASGVNAQLNVTGEPIALHPDAELALVRIAQEALANVRRHAQAREVTLTLSYMDDMVILDARDDGRGFDPAAVRTGVGLAGMRERLAPLGGRLDIESAPGAGTTVVASLPVNGT